jgi:hypothetical protein
VPPGQDIGHLPEAYPLRVGRNGRLDQERARAELRAFRHEVVLGHEPVVETEVLSQDTLPYLADEHPLIALMDLVQRPVVDHHILRRGDGWEI